MNLRLTLRGRFGTSLGTSEVARAILLVLAVPLLINLPLHGVKQESHAAIWISIPQPAEMRNVRRQRLCCPNLVQKDGAKLSIFNATVRSQHERLKPVLELEHAILPWPNQRVDVPNGPGRLHGSVRGKYFVIALSNTSDDVVRLCFKMRFW